jgi:hypothetical protein
MLRRTLALALSATVLVPAALALAPASALPGGIPIVDLTVPAARQTEAVVLSGEHFTGWATPANVTAKIPGTDLMECPPGSDTDECDHNDYVEPEIDSSRVAAPEGVPVDQLSGWRWDEAQGRFVEVPFQVDEVFTRYLDNSASGFAVYSGIDQHTSYAFDREGFRFTGSDPLDPCLAVPVSETATDPVVGLDTNDEVAFMAADAGAQAPADAKTPSGVEAVKAVTVRDPLTQAVSHLYVMRGRTPSFDAGNGYVSYERDANADTYEKSESSYDNYGNAARGVVCDEVGQVVLDPETGQPAVERRRPRDFATITTDRYRYRYDGRWLMTEINIADDLGGEYGPDVVDRWKARAFQQDPESETPCCGYEEEDTNWGGSSTLLGELSGPVRTVRETWGADSGTNVIRRETFYREEMALKSYLRVHVIPALDGIYAQWDYNAGRMTTFYNAQNPEGVAIDGQNDEVVGNFDDPCNAKYDSNGTSSTDQTYREAYKTAGLCEVSPYHQSVDLTDPTFSEASAALGWTQTSGPHGTIVDRTTTQVKDVTPGGAAQSVVAVPYYRDDSCFDDGTGLNPGPRLKLRSAGEPTTIPGTDTPRRCWTPADGPVDEDPSFYQGSIGTHGVHLLFVAESDNARTTVPVNEIVSEQRQVFLPGDQGGSVGEEYGRNLEKPLVGSVSDGSFEAGSDPEPEPVATGLTYDGDRTAGKKDDVVLAAILEDKQGPVVGRTVTFTLEGVEGTFDGVTDGSGRAEVTVPTGKGKSPDRMATYRFAGDADFAPSEGSTVLTGEKGQSENGGRAGALPTAP